MRERRVRCGTLPSKPPDDDEKPEDENEKYYVPQPSAALSLGHVVHPAEGACEYARCLRERVVLIPSEQRAIAVWGHRAPSVLAAS